LVLEQSSFEKNRWNPSRNPAAPESGRLREIFFISSLIPAFSLQGRRGFVL
jgi:hypothetical protein